MIRVLARAAFRHEACRPAREALAVVVLPSPASEEDDVAIEQRAQVDVAFLKSLGEAFNRHDLDGIMRHMTDDCVFLRSSGSEVVGTRYEGQAAVRAAFADVMSAIPDVQFVPIRDAVFGDRGISEWTITGTSATGAAVEARGLDLFEFRDGKIALKDSYIKRRW